MHLAWLALGGMLCSLQLSTGSFPRPLSRKEEQHYLERAAKGVIETIVGDVQRMELYAEKGYQRAVEIPDEVRAAFDALVADGYTGQLAK